MANESLNWRLFQALDGARRIHGLALDAFGLAPIESPYEVAFRAAGAELRRYGSGTAPGPAVPIVPAPIKRPYVWDLAPECSAVRRLLEAGAKVFLLDWQPTTEPLGLADYAHRLIGAASIRAAPVSFGWDRIVDFAGSLARPRALMAHLRVQRWTLDEFPFPGRLLAELAERVVRDDAFICGALTIDGRLATPAQITAPLLCVIDRHCRLVPPRSMLPFYQASGSSDKTLLCYEGDVGVALRHIGPLVGEQAHARLWPRITRWVCIHANPTATPRPDDAAA
jgi:poly(3-hydroxyalkanoate) synthetase